MLLDPFREFEVLMSSKIQQMSIVEMSPAERGLAEWKKLQDHQTALKGVETAVKNGESPGLRKLQRSFRRPIRSPLVRLKR